MFDICEVIFEVYLEDKLTNKQSMRAPKEMLMMNFIQTVNEVGKDKRPIKIKMFRQDMINVWKGSEYAQELFNHEVAFSNNAMIVWEDKRKGAE